MMRHSTTYAQNTLQYSAECTVVGSHKKIVHQHVQATLECNRKDKDTGRGRKEKEEKRENVHGSITTHCSMICDLDHISRSTYAMHKVPTLGRNVP